jgi:hypothetical protein
MLIAGLSNGKIAVIIATQDQWTQSTIDAHNSSVNAISINNNKSVNLIMSNKLYRMII